MRMLLPLVIVAALVLSVWLLWKMRSRNPGGEDGTDPQAHRNFSADGGPDVNGPGQPGGTFGGPGGFGG